MCDWNYLEMWIDDTNKPYIKPHSHNFYELVYFSKGRVLTNIGDKNYEVSRGDFVIIERKVIHDEKRYEDTRTVCLIFSCEREVKTELLTDSTGEVLNLLLTMNKEARTKLYAHKEILQLKLNELYYMVERIRKSDKSASRDFLYAINYISDNYRQKITFDKLAKSLNLSYSYFQHRFKSLTGFSPRSFLVKIRLENAERMLIAGELNCTEIAYYCGFSNSAQFTAMFKKAYGISPKDYKKKFRG